MSSLIIEGVVEKVMPSRRAGQTWIETDSVIRIAKTFKGSVEGPTIVISAAIPGDNYADTFLIGPQMNAEGRR